MSIHEEKSELAGKDVKLKNGTTLQIEDWWDRLVQKSWMKMSGNPACLCYAMDVATKNLPLDDEVLYGHTKDGLGHLVHITEVE